MEKSYKLTKHGAELIRRLLEKEVWAFFEDTGITLKIVNVKYKGGLIFSVTLAFRMIKYVMTMSWDRDKHRLCMLSMRESKPIEIQFDNEAHALQWIVRQHGDED